MKLKSLLIGSAAALAASVTAAQAADTVQMAPEPEPEEYVRICDVYGAGFFYIPGTETCLGIGGYVFYEIGATSQGAGDSPNYHGYAADEYTKYIRARINFDARSETEWGTLQSYVRLQTDYTDGAPGRGGTAGISADPDLGLDQAWLSLGGLRMGYSESAFTFTPNGGNSGFGTHSWYGLNYGYSQRQFVQYNFSGGNGFFATVSLEADDYENTGDYAPDVVGKLGVNQGWGTAWATVGVDSDSIDSVSRGALSGTGDTEYAASAGLHLNVPNMEGSSFRLIGYYASDVNAFWDYGEWSVLGSYYHQFTPDFGASVGGQYISDTNFDGAGSPDAWLAELNLVWTPVQDFEVRSEITYADHDGFDDGSVSGFLRFTRYFGAQ